MLTYILIMNLINGDCLEELKKIPEKSVDLVICDLPYGITHIAWDKKIDLDKLWIELKRVGKERTPYFFFCNMKFGYEIIKSNEAWFKYDMVWVKNKLCNPLTTTHRFGTSHENIMVFYKKAPVYNYLQYHKKNMLDGVTNKIRFCNKNEQVQRVEYEPRLPLSVIKTEEPSEEEINTVLECNSLSVSTNKYQQLKPTELIEKLLKYFSNEGDIVLDPTMNTGSTGLACKNLNRKFIGIELNKELYDIAVERLNAN